MQQTCTDPHVQTPHDECYEEEATGESYIVVVFVKVTAEQCTTSRV